MNIRFIVWVYSVFWLVTGAGFLFAARAGEETIASAGQLIPPPSTGTKPWYQRLYCFTEWREDLQLPKVKVYSYFPYSYARFLSEVFRTNVLAAGWETNTIRAKAWVPKLPGMVQSPLDAYVYRQAWRGNVLHVCDTRPYLVVAVRFEAEDKLDAESTASMLDLVSNLFKIKLVTPDGPVIDRASGMYLTHFWVVNALGRSPLVERPVQGVTTAPLIAFNSVFGVCGKGVAIFSFQKNFFGGYDLNGDVPLFQLASSQPTKVEQAIDYLSVIKQASATNLPAIVKVLKSLPRLTLDRTIPNSYQFRLLAQAKYLGYDKLEGAMEALGSDDESIALISKALTVLPVEDDLHGRALRMEQIALRKLKTNKSKLAQAELRHIADITKNQGIRDECKRLLARFALEEPARK